MDKGWYCGIKISSLLSIFAMSNTLTKVILIPENFTSSIDLKNSLTIDS